MGVGPTVCDMQSTCAEPPSAKAAITQPNLRMPSRDHVTELLLHRDSPLARYGGGRSLPLPLSGAAGRLGRVIADELHVDTPVAVARTGRLDNQHGVSQLRRVVPSIACPFVRTVNTIRVKAAGRPAGTVTFAVPLTLQRRVVDQLATAGRRKPGFRRPRNDVSGGPNVDSRFPASHRGRLRFVSAARLSL